MTFLEWTQHVIGLRYRTIDGVCLCVGYRPEAGFVMRNLTSGQEREVSERAIGRTIYPVRMTFGAWRALGLAGATGKVPEPAELNPNLAHHEAQDLHIKVLGTLVASGLVGQNIGGDPYLTDLGKQVYLETLKDPDYSLKVNEIRASDFSANT